MGWGRTRLKQRKTQRDKRPRPHFYVDGLMPWSGWCSKQSRADLTTFGKETRREE
ncbi:hypothetical protein COLO4_04555 [Corchorus olitorius]|uniref:Uncharacterized protein n=1 Tax=Corchorus olitorius TaxID=93759 RepID=A0A1R3KTH3_9ROSI|nr:hypothetical protein COLO4_04555 [Corchorus olitorius]